jgi:autotransporter-associated beta strand protein
VNLNPNAAEMKTLKPHSKLATKPVITSQPLAPLGIDIQLNARTLTIAGPGDYIIAGVISGSGSIFKGNFGDLSLSGAGANTFTGTTFINAGIPGTREAPRGVGGSRGADDR